MRIYATLFLGLALFVPLLGEAAERHLNVVATQTTFADIVKRVGKDKVNVTAIASPRFNLHSIQPKPSDVRKVSKADLYVNAGLDLEVWSDPLLEASGRTELFRNAPRNIDVSLGIPLLKVPKGPVSRAQGDIHVFGNPHFQMNPQNARIMARNIADRLKEFDPANASYYEENVHEFLSMLDVKISEWKIQCAHCQGREIISYHEDIAYLADFLGLKADRFLEPKPGIPPTPKHLEFLENYAKQNNIKAIVMSTYFPQQVARRLAQRVGGKVVTIAQAVGEVPGTEDFFSLFDYNIKQIAEGVR